MALELQIRGTGDEVKVRNPWAVALLPFVTLGIYHLVWWYRVNRELATSARRRARTSARARPTRCSRSSPAG